MPDFDDEWVHEPSGRRRKYRVYDCRTNSLDRRKGPKRWTLLVSVTVIPEDDILESESPVPSPLAGPGPGGHKPSFKSTKLARRARSFKDDFLGKISQMRSPAGPGGLRSQSPKGRRPKPDMVDHVYHHQHVSKGPTQELEGLAKQIQIALKHFRDVVAKQKLEMLPGNGTIILDTVWLINLAVKSSVAANSSSTISSATNYMYQSVARLIKLCDDALIDSQSSELDKTNVDEVVSQVESAVQALIQLAQEKLSQTQTNYKTTPRSSYGNTSLEMPAQRNSLPDIPLTPREREILEQTSCVPNMVRSSHSTESILRDSSPPPKPPLPDRLCIPDPLCDEPLINNLHRVFISFCRTDPDDIVTPPPLPPKKKNRIHHLAEKCYSTENSPIASSLERVSIRSKSPDDSISLCSASAGSLDSMLDQSRDEEEIKAIMENTYDGNASLENHTSDIFCMNSSNNSWEESSLSSSMSNQLNDLPVCDYHRLSNTDSGIMSFHSSSYSKRSSQQSSVSSQWATGSSHQHTSKHTSSSTSTTMEMVKSESIVQNMHQIEENTTLKNFSQKTNNSSTSSVTTLTNNNGSHSSVSKDEVDFIDDDIPPAIPQKTKKKHERQPSPYDNVPDSNFSGEILVPCQMHQPQDNSKPPPLPPKKKHIMAYMEMFGNCSHANDQEFLRHSVHMVQAHWAQPPTTSTALPTTQSCSFSHTSHSSSRSSHMHIQTLNIQSHSNADQRIPSPMRSPNSTTSSTHSSSSIPPALPPKARSRTSSTKSPPQTPTAGGGIISSGGPVITELKPPSPVKALPDLLEHTTAASSNSISPKPPEERERDEKGEGDLPIVSGGSVEVNPCDIDLMEELNVEQYLIMKKPDEEGPDIRGGPIDALIIQATKATKNGEEKENVFTYQEAFLTTYRTFITPFDLICKLIRRYNHFYYQQDKKPRSREAFALIVRVVADLTASDLNEPLQRELMNFVQQLIACGELTLAKALRVKHLERHEAKQMNMKYANINNITSLSLSARNLTLLDFKSEQIAEQMTLLDADLFMKIEIPEVLIWAQEQNEERSPNLTRFTEHFNKMSYWARTRILTAEGKDVREKYFLKFIKIMKHLRKINNFNSYLALLSALDSAPVRRLEWQKHVQEGLKEYCALIDSSSSFRAYRQALAETQPPCIPYIGLVLQDLTFVHIGNSNLLPDGSINFSKRWQQFNIVENMKKFKKCSYSFKKNERIIQFFQNFDDCIGEDAMWQLSESIKPRGGKKIT